eukprot:4792844-Karenia_brevis.AAC.1
MNSEKNAVVTELKRMTSTKPIGAATKKNVGPPRDSNNKLTPRVNKIICDGCVRPFISQQYGDFTFNFFYIITIAYICPSLPEAHSGASSAPPDPRSHAE